MSGPGISLGLGARKLKDKDFFGKSDPYVIISKPSTSGGFTVLRTSDTRQVRKEGIKIGLNNLLCLSEHIEPRLG